MFVGLRTGGSNVATTVSCIFPPQPELCVTVSSWLLHNLNLFCYDELVVSKEAPISPWKCTSFP